MGPLEDLWPGADRAVWNSTSHTRINFQRVHSILMRELTVNGLMRVLMLDPCTHNFDPKKAYKWVSLGPT